MSDPKAQLHPNDSLGWLVDRMADPDGDHRLCPKACARAKAALLQERANMALAAERDRELCDHMSECWDALVLARDAIDRLMGDSDLIDGDDDSVEMRAMRAIARALGYEYEEADHG